MKAFALTLLSLASTTAFADNFRCIAYNYQTQARLKFDIDLSGNSSLAFIAPGGGESEKIPGIAAQVKTSPLGKFIFSNSETELFLVSLESSFEGDVTRPEGDVVHVRQDTINFYHTSCTKKSQFEVRQSETN